jgi:hypothetical protein
MSWAQVWDLVPVVLGTTAVAGGYSGKHKI